MQRHHAITTISRGQSLYIITTALVSNIVPCITVACLDGFFYLYALVDGQVQGNCAVATMDGLQGIGIVA